MVIAFFTAMHFLFLKKPVLLKNALDKTAKTINLIKSQLLSVYLQASGISTRELQTLFRLITETISHSCGKLSTCNKFLFCVSFSFSDRILTYTGLGEGV